VLIFIRLVSDQSSVLHIFSDNVLPIFLGLLGLLIALLRFSTLFRYLIRNSTLLAHVHCPSPLSLLFNVICSSLQVPIFFWHLRCSFCHYTLSSLRWNLWRAASNVFTTVGSHSSALYSIVTIITHRRSIAERGGCFQRRLFVCRFVCLFVNIITSERLNIERWNLAVRCIVQKYRPSSNFGIIGPTPGSPHPKMWRFAEWLRKKSTSSCIVRQFYAGGKISACCLISNLHNYNFILQADQYAYSSKSLLN